jgi:hypothetical protein
VKQRSSATLRETCPRSNDPPVKGWRILPTGGSFRMGRQVEPHVRQESPAVKRSAPAAFQPIWYRACWGLTISPDCVMDEPTRVKGHGETGVASFTGGGQLANVRYSS